MRVKQDDIVIVGSARTAVGSYLGELKTVPVEELGEVSLKAAIKRAGIQKEEIQEVIAGNVIGSQTSNNVGRIIGLNIGLPVESTGMTVNRVCGSGFQSIISAAQEILFGQADVVAAGGVESLSRAPFYLPESVRYEGLKIGHHELIDSHLVGFSSLGGRNYPIPHMGNTAENIAERYGITREEQDEFALLSNDKSVRAQENGRFAKEITPVEVRGRKGQVTIVDKDGDPRPGNTIEKLARLKPAFIENGTVTAGNASGLNDGGAFSIVTSGTYAKDHNLTPLGKVIDYSVAGCDPNYMGMGPYYAITKLLQQNHLTLDDIDLLEINEAFSAQVLGCLRELGISTDSEFYHEKFNVNGGAVSLGHPLAMSGARITTTMLYEFQERPNAHYGIVSACIGGGQGIAMLLENPLATI